MTYQTDDGDVPPTAAGLEVTSDPGACGDWCERDGPGHVVQFYDDDAFLIDAVSRFVGIGLGAGDAGVAVMTRAHGERLSEALRAYGLDVTAIAQQGRYVVLDAAETLAQIMVDGAPDATRFAAIVGGTLARAAATSARGHVRVIGEMVALLAADGKPEAAIRLEELWNDLAVTVRFSLLCAYPISAFSREADGASFLRVCAEHSDVTPAESFPALAHRGEQLRAVARLQQRASALATELSERVEERAEIDRRRDEYLAMLGHELRNPLEPIVNAVDILRHFATAHPALVRAHDLLDRQVGHMARLVDDLLDVARITRGKIGLRPAPVDLAEVLGAAVETARALVDRRGHRLDVVTPAEPIWVSGDAARLTQVFGNLLTNAAKFTEPGGHITLSAERLGGAATVRVRDTGVGIDPRTLERIFEPFVQNDASLDRSAGGLGIGLTLVRRLVDLHGGEVRAHSDGLGRGSELVVRLPALTGPPPRPELPDTRAAKHHTAKPLASLSVDVNLDAAESLTTLLELHGHAVRAAHDGGAALVIVGEGFRPDVAIVDLGLPGMNGFELAGALRRHPVCPDAALVALSGYGADEDMRRARAAGFDHHLVKPIEFAALRELLAALQARRAGSESAIMH